MKISRSAQIAIVVSAVVASSAIAPLLAVARQASPTPAERVAALKQSLAQSQKQLRQYEWIETTILSLKGEEKSRMQKRCYYGADGKLTKVPMDKPAEEPQQAGRGGRGGRVAARVVENKKDEMKEYMEKAAGLIQQYVPPDPEDIQRAKDKEKVKVESPSADRVRLTFADYLLAGDRMVVDVDAAANRLVGLSVASYIEKKEDAVALTVKLAALADGTSYTAESTLDVAAKNIRVVTQNSGHRPVGK